MTEKEFNCYKTYVALKLYFEGKFDYFKYQGRINLKPATYEKRKDKFFFSKLSKKYDEKELVNFFVANFIYDGSYAWIGDLVTNGESNYSNWRSNNENITYNFEKDCCLLNSKLDGSPYINAFKNTIILNELFNQNIMMETLVILNDCTYFKVDSGVIKPFYLLTISADPNPMWQETIQPLLIKYTPFVKYDKKIMVKIINKYFTRHL